MKARQARVEGDRMKPVDIDALRRACLDAEARAVTAAWHSTARGAHFAWLAFIAAKRRLLVAEDALDWPTAEERIT